MNKLNTLFSLLRLIIMLMLCPTVYAEKNGLNVAYHNDIKSLLDNRCVVCHSCYDAPCQLKLSSSQGLTRGAHKNKVYDGTRLLADSPSRLFVDAQSVKEWREKDFFPVLNENKKESSFDDNLLSQMLLLKARNPLLTTSLNNAKLPESSFDLSLNRNHECPTIDEFKGYANEHALWGMPYALPGLNPTELEDIKNWLAAGAPIDKQKKLNKSFQKKINRWELFFNKNDLKSQLVTRYIYEHLFLAHLYFDDLPPGEYFKLVRSSTPPGEAMKIIATRRPFDDPANAPGLDRPIKQIYYRLQHVQSTIVAKNHIPYALNKQRLQRFNELFFKPSYQVKELPNYSTELASNPFAVFIDIPARSRYQFMLDNAQFTIRGFMKGAVCRGQVALNVINDHFWVVFVDPEHAISKALNNALPKSIEQLDLPAERSSNAGLLSNWTEYSDSQAEYLKTKSRVLSKVVAKNRPDLDWIWQGDGNNQNAALTVFRHFDSASVVKGLVGQAPKTTWLIDYPILERIHYLLVAGFDVYGNAGHQLATRLYMDFLRMESEFTFLALLPKQTRLLLRDEWYQDSDESVKDYIYGSYAYINATSMIDYPSESPAQGFLYKQIKNHLSKVLSQQYQLQNSKDNKIENELKPLTKIQGEIASLLPEMSLLMITNEQKAIALYTLIRNSAHSNVTSLFNEKSNRIPEEDYVTLLPGVVGAYPDALWRVDKTELSLFVKKLTHIQNEETYADLMQRFGIRRSHKEFWEHSDALHKFYKKQAPVEYGLLDYNRLENR